MLVCRFLYRNQVFYGLLIEKNQISFIENPFKNEGKIIKQNREPVSFSEVKLLAPVNPSKIVAVGLNYIDHAKELEMEVPAEPIIFLKPPTSVIGPGEEIVFPVQAQQVDYEAELALIIGREARFVSESKARDYILGYTCSNDVTARDLQKKDVQWTRAKSFDTFTPLGPWIATDIEPLDLKIELYLNRRARQSSNSKNMIFNPYRLVSFVSEIMTLKPGDVIMTGTPPGVGRLKPGDVVEVKIERIGVLRNKVVSLDSQKPVFD